MLPRPFSQSPSTRRCGSALTAAVCTILLVFSSPAQNLARRLILKDGSYQSVTKYEVKGSRVRYLSAERGEWEELPASLVDWPATENYEKDRAANGSIPEAAELDKELETERQFDESRLPQVAPGLRLPEDSGVFLLDNFKGEPQLVEVQQTAGDLNRNVRGNIFRGAINPVSGSKQTIEIEGEHSGIQSHVDVPSIYLKLEESPGLPEAAGRQKDSGDTSRSGRAASQTPEQPQQAEQPERAVVPFDRYRIVRAQVKGGKRVLGDVKRGITGKVSQDQKLVKTTIDSVSGGWLKITPTESLTPGEYAIVETTDKEGMNLYVWDFGVNPNAPANPNPWRPEPKQTSRQADKSSDTPK